MPFSTPPAIVFGTFGRGVGRVDDNGTSSTSVRSSLSLLGVGVGVFVRGVDDGVGPIFEGVLFAKMFDGVFGEVEFDKL